ncbi:WD40 repeat domain-containing protein [Belliella sp. DSM 111904]|uniref:WD40 repeat domain-containing protein n=1 Tax=Belliella filtrata TaxID=2923435 RepID=A0ABS9UYC7_9BACT|nr:WD40 repeat domain-containing protein [Belliella filtrata]MCH7409175.1 WD40 repeat domain-containing protein [Belliella filtrata]
MIKHNAMILTRVISIFLLNCIAIGTLQAQEVKSAEFVNHGVQLTASMIQGSLFVDDKNGNTLIYTVVRGEPAHLLAFDVASKKLVLDVPLPKADGVWDLTQSTDGDLYIPGANGSLFKHTPGTQEIEDLGIVLEGETYLWNLTSGFDREVFGATYPGCRIFRYHPDHGFSDIGNGPIVEGENYVRSLAFHHRTGLLYAGIGSRAHLIEIDPKTGSKKSLLPEKYQDKEFVYSLEIIPGKNGEDRLFALLTAGSETLIYNLKTKVFEQEITGMDMKAITSDKTGKQVYLTSKGNILAFDPKKNFRKSKVILKESGTSNAFLHKENGDLLMLSSGGNLIEYNFKAKTEKSTKLAIPGQPIPINAITFGPDGKVWTGGYLAGGHASFDPTTGIHQEHKGLDQTEGMAVFEDKIYIGIYPKGKFYVLDTKNEWSIADSNPKALGQIDGQSRSFALAAIPELRKMAFGMIPEYGKLGGALVIYDIDSEELKTFEQPVPRQGISSLIFNKGALIGGTTISGGLGKMPETKEAKLFVWDLDRMEVVEELVPVAGASAVTGMIEGPDGNIWGMADGTLFIFDVESNSLISTHKLYDFPEFKSHIWRSAFLVLHPDGNIYGTDNRMLFKIDPSSKAVTKIAEDTGLLVMGDDGTLFFRKATELWSYKPKSN